MEKLKNLLVGSHLYDINDKHITIMHDQYGLIQLDIETHDGDCCGYAFIDANLTIKPAELARTPVITAVEWEEEDGNYCDSISVCIFGEHKQLAEINGEAGSGSGWAYGACAWVSCKAIPDFSDWLCSW